MGKVTKHDREAGLNQLRSWVKPGDTVYTTLRSVSRSGMSRNMEVFVIKDNEPIRLTWWICKAGIGGARYDLKTESLKVGGCGMDMGFHIVYSLSCALFCYDGGYNHDAAYSLKHRWL